MYNNIGYIPPLYKYEFNVVKKVVLSEKSLVYFMFFQLLFNNSNSILRVTNRSTPLRYNLNVNSDMYASVLFSVLLNAFSTLLFGVLYSINLFKVQSLRFPGFCLPVFRVLNTWYDRIFGMFGQQSQADS